METATDSRLCYVINSIINSIISTIINFIINFQLSHGSATLGVDDGDGDLTRRAPLHVGLGELMGVLVVDVLDDELLLLEELACRK